VLCCQELGEDVSGDAAASDENNAPADAAQPPADALEALLAGGAGNLQALLNIPDADDETMVQLAIALSLQDQVRLPLLITTALPYLYCSFVLPYLYLYYTTAGNSTQPPGPGTLTFSTISLCLMFTYTMALPYLTFTNASCLPLPQHRLALSLLLLYYVINSGVFWIGS